MSEPASIALLPAAELRRRIVARELSPTELLEACLGRIERHNDTINAVVTVDPTAGEQALAVERRLAAGQEPGLLCGLPVGIKDVTDVRGLRTTYGSPLFADHVPDEDALVVRRLRQAGAVILGKTNTPEFAAGGNTFNEVFGRTRNPWNPARSAGGSTGGGAAALAAGMIALAEGTDLGGSLRVPASFCGVVGLRPSLGLVPTLPTAWPDDDLSVTGPMGRSAADAALMLEAIRGPVSETPGRRRSGEDVVAAIRRGPAKGTGVAYAPDVAGIGIDPSIERACRDAAEALSAAGIDVEEVDLDLSEGLEIFLALRGRWMVEHHETRLDRLDELGENLAGNIRAGLALQPDQIEAAETARERLREKAGKTLAQYGHLLTPCAPVPPFPVEQNYPAAIGGRAMGSYIEWIAPTFVLTLTGLPVACAPAGLGPGGLPVGIQIVGAADGEEAVLALAHRVQERSGVGSPPLDRRP